MQLDVRTDLKAAERYLQGLRKDQVPFATAYALTQTAKDAQGNIIEEMQRVFDRPKPFTLNGTFVKPATKRDLTALIKLKDGHYGANTESSKRGYPDKYLAAEITGGARRPTAFEKLLIYNGLMPPGYFAVPTNFAPKDPFGNVPPGFYTRIRSQLEIGDEFQRKSKTPKSQRRTSAPKNRVKDSSPIVQAQRENAARARRRKQASLRGLQKAKARPRYPIFNVYPGREKNKHLKPGIYERLNSGFGKTLRPLFIYVDRAPSYKPRLHFNKIVQGTVATQLAKNFERGFALASATQRPIR
jgi:hypothetical protein